MINQNSEILNKLFFTELQMLVEKYNNIDEVTKKQIESIVTSLRDEELQSYLMRNMDKLLDILKCTDEIDEEIVTFFVWYNFQINEITIGVARECIKELKENNYLEIGSIPHLVLLVFHPVKSPPIFPLYRHEPLNYQYPPPD